MAILLCVYSIVTDLHIIVLTFGALVGFPIGYRQAVKDGSGPVGRAVGALIGGFIGAVVAFVVALVILFWQWGASM